MGFSFAQRAGDADLRNVLELRAEWRARDFERKFDNLANDVQALAVSIAVQQKVDAQQFHRFARLLHDPIDASSALFWAPLVKAQERDAVVAQARSKENAEFDINELTPDGRVTSAGPREEYLPPLVEENFDRSPPLLGVDQLSLPGRRASFERARNEGEPIATPPVNVYSQAGAALGFLMFWPVYATGEVPEAPEERRNAFRGVAGARFRFDRLLPALIADTPPIIEALEIYVDRGDDGAAPMHVAAYDPTSEAFVVGNATDGAAAVGAVTLTRQFDVLGRHWTIISNFPAAYLASQRSSGPWAWLVFGLIATGLMVAYVERERARRVGVEAIVARRTSELKLANETLSQEMETRRRTEATLRESEERFRRIFEESPVGIVLGVVETARILQVNGAFAGMLGYDPGELAGRTIDELLHPDEPRSSALEAQRGGRRWVAFERRYLTKSGKVAWARVSSTLLAQPDGRPNLALGVSEDITQRKLTEQQLVQAQKMEAIGNLTGGMAHDFNNLLGVIIGNLDLARPLVKSVDAVDELVGESLDAALRGADLTRRLLAFARQQPLQPQRVELNELVAGMIRLLGRTLGENIEISFDLAPDIWPVVADPAQLESSLANLATNARDAMPNGGRLMIATGNRRLDADYAASHSEVAEGDYAMIEVSDTGSGITPEVLERVFEPFYTTKERGKGTGLGLSMVFGFMKQSGGHINIYSEPGAGTTFRLYLPRVIETAQPVEERAAVPLARGGGETVLAVEDNIALRRVVLRQLREFGYRVLEADGAAAAIAMLESEKVDLLFTDIVMPGDLDGFELARRAFERWPSLKVVLTSGFPEAKVNGKFGSLATSVRLLSKPYRKEDLARILREVLDG